MAGVMKCFTGKQKDLKRGIHRQHTGKSSKVKDSRSPTENLSEQLCLAQPRCPTDPSASLFLLALFSLAEPWQAPRAFLELRNQSGKAPIGVTSGERLLLMLLSG